MFLLINALLSAFPIIRSYSVLKFNRPPVQNEGAAQGTDENGQAFLFPVDVTASYPSLLPPPFLFPLLKSLQLSSQRRRRRRGAAMPRPGQAGDSTRVCCFVCQESNFFLE